MFAYVRGSPVVMRDPNGMQSALDYDAPNEEKFKVTPPPPRPPPIPEGTHALPPDPAEAGEFGTPARGLKIEDIGGGGPGDIGGAVDAGQSAEASNGRSVEEQVASGIGNSVEGFFHGSLGAVFPVYGLYLLFDAFTEKQDAGIDAVDAATETALEATGAESVENRKAVSDGDPETLAELITSTIAGVLIGLRLAKGPKGASKRKGKLKAKDRRRQERERTKQDKRKGIHRGDLDDAHRDQRGGSVEALIDKEQGIKGAYPDQAANRTRQNIKKKLRDEALKGRKN